MSKQVFQPPALRSIGSTNVTYGAVLRGVRKQAAMTNGLIFATVAIAVAVVAMKVARMV